MRLLSFLFALAVLAAIAAFATKPSEKDVERQLKDVLLAELNKQDVNGDRDAFANAALIGCKLRPSDCYKLVRSGIDLTYDDRALYARIDLKGFGRQASCYGAFTKVACPGGLQKD